MSGSLTADNRPTYLYRIYDDEGALLYIGIALNLNSRMNQHRKHWRNGEWYRTAGPIRVELYEDRTSAALAEYRAINKEQPIHNVANEDQYKDITTPDPVPLRTEEHNAGRWRMSYGS